MGISLDLYDFFAHLIPGSVFVMAFLYGFQEAWLRSHLSKINHWAWLAVTLQHCPKPVTFTNKIPEEKR